MNADQHFEALLAEAKKAPAQADWKALRQVFAETSMYQPYDFKRTEELERARGLIGQGDCEGAAAALGDLMERERWMRLDAHALAAWLYRELGDPAKEEFHRTCFEEMAKTVFTSGSGESYDDAIQVLFIEEEYILLAFIGAKMRTQSLQSHDGRDFDVLEIEPAKGGSAMKLYFNIDLPRKLLD